MPERIAISAGPDEFERIFHALRGILVDHAPRLVVVVDAPGRFHLDTGSAAPNGGPLFFASAQIKRNYVSFHLMPVYMHPALLVPVSPALRKRMQGKSCFNFKRLDPLLISELAALTRSGFDAFAEAGHLRP
jgi:hypothetical protein